MSVKQAAPGLTYQIEYSDDLAVGVWLPSGSPVTGTGTPATFMSDLSASAQRFFRLRVLP